jgi:hypothetical protein
MTNTANKVCLPSQTISAGYTHASEKLEASDTVVPRIMTEAEYDDLVRIAALCLADVAWFRGRCAAR